MRWLICLLLFLAGCAPFSEQRDASSSAPAKDWSVRVDGRLVPVHVVQPKTPPPWPTAMLLHGSSGLGRGYLVWPVAYALAARGVASAVVEYFDALPDQVGHKGAVQYFSVRERQLDAVVDGILAQPEVMGPQIGVYGYSLGGFHGLALAVTNPRVAAVVSLAGGACALEPSRTGTPGAAGARYPRQDRAFRPCSRDAGRLAASRTPGSIAGLAGYWSRAPWRGSRATGGGRSRFYRERTVLPHRAALTTLSRAALNSAPARHRRCSTAP